jgi:hypothetical protein
MPESKEIGWGCQRMTYSHPIQRVVYFAGDPLQITMEKLKSMTAAQLVQAAEIKMFEWARVLREAKTLDQESKATCRDFPEPVVTYNEIPESVGDPALGGHWMRSVPK